MLRENALDSETAFLVAREQLIQLTELPLDLTIYKIVITIISAELFNRLR